MADICLKHKLQLRQLYMRQLTADNLYIQLLFGFQVFTKYDIYV